jgi:hypothetical protein
MQTRGSLIINWMGRLMLLESDTDELFKQGLPPTSAREPPLPVTSSPAFLASDI